jgi:hypothetical protein
VKGSCSEFKAKGVKKSIEDVDQGVEKQVSGRQPRRGVLESAAYQNM